MPGTTDLAEQTRYALRRLAKAVVVITCAHEGERYAMAATAVSELSMDPPSMLVCVNQSASLHRPLSAGAGFCINILHHEQEPIARACGGQVKGEERFSLGSWEKAALDIPVLAGAQASIVCTNETAIPYGTHGIFIGRVVEVRAHGDVEPLVYVDGRYGAMREAS
jgi:flavin reductase (DIM6/NTAB) family NADH-FMN oxidoreductase RutF